MCSSIFMPSLKKPHPATPKKLLIEYPVTEITLRHCLYSLPISCNFSGLGHLKQLLVEAIIEIIDERGDIH